MATNIQSFSTTGLYRTEQVTPAESAQEKKRESKDIKRVGDVKKQKKYRKRRRIPDIQRKARTMQRQRYLARILRGQQLRVLRSTTGKLLSMLPTKQPPNQAQQWTLQAINLYQYMYPSKLIKEIKEQYASFIPGETGNNTEIETNSGVLQQMIAYESDLGGLLSLLAICRLADDRQRNTQQQEEEEEEEEEDNNKQKETTREHP